MVSLLVTSFSVHQGMDGMASHKHKGMSEEERTRRIAATREMAAALLEDLRHIRAFVVSTNPAPDELRRLSVTVRRILIDQDLAIVAGPRLGRIVIESPNIKPFHKYAGQERYKFFGDYALNKTTRKGLMATSWLDLV